MSDTLDAGAETPEDGPNMKQLRELAKKGEQAEKALAEANDLRREVAVLKSGIDAETPLGKMFLKAYDGDPADVEAMRTAAAEVGVPFKGEAPAPADTPPEPNGTEDRQALASEAPADTGVQENPIEAAQKKFLSDMQTGKTWSDAAGGFVGQLAQAAAAGDSRVLVD